MRRVLQFLLLIEVAAAVLAITFVPWNRSWTEVWSTLTTPRNTPQPTGLNDPRELERIVMAATQTNSETKGPFGDVAWSWLWDQPAAPQARGSNQHSDHPWGVDYYGAKVEALQVSIAWPMPAVEMAGVMTMAAVTLWLLKAKRPAQRSTCPICKSPRVGSYCANCGTSALKAI